jgi:hypothetical protein
MLSAGVGPQTANSFLVVAGRTPDAADALVRDGQLWLAGSDRARELMDVRVVRPAGHDYSIALQDPPMATRLPPLVVSTDLEPGVLLGSNLEDEIAAVAASASSPGELEALLCEWWSAVQEQSRQGDLQVDVMPRHFVRDGDGVPRFVNGRWHWQEAAPASWPLLRSMLLLVLERLWPAGAMAGLSWSLTPADAALALARLVDPHLTREDLDAAIVLEAELQARVRNRPAADIALELRDVTDRQLALLVPRPPLAQILERPLTAEAESKRRLAQAQMLELQARDTVIGNVVELEAAQRQVKELAAKVEWLRSRQPAAGMQRARRTLSRVKRRVLDP